MNKVSLTKDIEELHARGMLETLLSDRTTGGNIIWAAHEYARKGDGYSARSPILISQITGKNARTVKPRAAKRKERREGRTKERGEVFTPFWVVQKMCGIAERELCPAKRAKADRDAFIRARVLEICCGEAPFLTTRYAPDTGERIDPPDRAGILDRKLAVVRKHTKSRKTYIARAMEALRSVYGYEFSGDSLFIARINVLKSLIEHAGYAGYPLTCAEARDAAETVSRNIWQMDGLLGLPPYGIAAPTAAQLSLFEDLIPAPECSVYDYRGNQPVKYSAIGKEECEMKFDFIIGNPPYQETATEKNRSYPRPLYDKFMDEAYKLADKIELITPGRFLFNAGGTKNDWNKKLLNDPHFKVLKYEADNSKYFNNVEIKGGVAITYYDKDADFGAIEVFTPYEELNSILHKVINDNFIPVSAKTSAPLEYRFTDSFYADYNDMVQKLEEEGSTPNGLKTFSFDKMPEIFHDEKPKDSNIYIYIWAA